MNADQLEFVHTAHNSKVVDLMKLSFLIDVQRRDKAGEPYAQSPKMSSQMAGQKGHGLRSLDDLLAHYESPE
jgi:hypothetical protein